MEELLILPDHEIISTRKIRSTCQLESELGVVESGEDIRDNGRLVDVHAQNLTLLVDADDSVRGFVLGCDEDRVAADVVHVYAGAGFEVIEVDETDTS